MSEIIVSRDDFKIIKEFLSEFTTLLDNFQQFQNVVVKKIQDLEGESTKLKELLLGKKKETQSIKVDEEEQDHVDVNLILSSDEAALEVTTASEASSYPIMGENEGHIEDTDLKSSQQVKPSDDEEENFVREKLISLMDFDETDTATATNDVEEKKENAVNITQSVDSKYCTVVLEKLDTSKMDGESVRGLDDKRIDNLCNVDGFIKRILNSKLKTSANGSNGATSGGVKKKRLNFEQDEDEEDTFDDDDDVLDGYGICDDEEIAITTPLIEFNMINEDNDDDDAAADDEYETANSETESSITTDFIPRKKPKYESERKPLSLLPPLQLNLLKEDSISNRSRSREIIVISDDDDDKSQYPNLRKRKRIHKIIDVSELKETTKRALQAEDERLKHLESQPVTNKSENTFDIYLDADRKLLIDPKVSCYLKNHQIQGIQFMYQSCYEHVESSQGSGCILSHLMGLGKTLQVVVLSATLLANPKQTKTKRILILAPINVLLNWKHEFQYWLRDCDRGVKVFDLVGKTSNQQRRCTIKRWQREGGALLLGYTSFVHLFKKDLLHGADLIVCDEGHLLKNRKSNISHCVNQVRTRRRIVLTGSPLQNNLMEYHCMIDFAKPNLLGTAKEFATNFSNPIYNGQHADSSEADVILMKHRAHILHKLTSGFVQRMDHKSVASLLPPKKEFVISIRLSQVQRELYRLYLKRNGYDKSIATVNGGKLFIDFLNLYCIWTHPLILKSRTNKFKDFFDETSSNLDSDDASSSSCGSDITDVNDSWWSEVVEDNMEFDMALSGKIVLFAEILKLCERIGDKLLLFSHSLYSLNLIERFLSLQVNEHWECGVDYFRIDGSTNIAKRKKYIDEFNRESSGGKSRARLFLISTKAGGIGINLCAANRVIIFDAFWNPVSDIQAYFRVYRFGQTKSVFIYRFLAHGTMEEKVYSRQVIKQSLSLRVVDEQQLDRHFTSQELRELYKFEPIDNENKQKAAPNDDAILTDLLKSCGDKWIAKYHEHDSLFENRIDESLSEQEQSAAWAQYVKEQK